MAGQWDQRTFSSAQLVTSRVGAVVKAAVFSPPIHVTPVTLFGCDAVDTHAHSPAAFIIHTLACVGSVRVSCVR